MAPKNVIFALLALTSFAYGQTRALFVNTNGTVQWGATLRFDGPLDFTTNGFAATTRSNLSLGLPALTNTSNAGLLSALGGLATNGDAAGLTNFPALLLTTNSSANAFPSALLRTNGDGSGLTNLPNANLSNATGVLPLANGGTGQTNAALAIEALLPAYTNNEGKVLGLDTNLALVWTTNAGGGGSGSVTNVDASGGSTGLTFTGGPITNGGTLTLGGTLNLASGGTGATNASGARTALELGTAATNDATAFQPASTNLDTLANNNGGALTNVSVDLTAVLPAYSNNAAKVLAVASGETNVEWIAVSNTVTDASTLTNFPASILQTNSADGSFPAFLLRTNGSAAGLTSFPASLLTTNGDASGLTNFPTLNQNTTGTASNVTGVVAIANGGSGQTTAAAAIEAFLPTYSGNADKILALNSNATGLVWTTNAGGGAGIVNLADTTNGVTNTLGLANGGTGGSNALSAQIGIGIVFTNGTNSSAVQIGQGAVYGDNPLDGNVVIGQNARVGNSGGAQGNGSVVIGLSATNTGDSSGGISIGESARSGASGLAIGRDTWSANSIAIGAGSISTNSPSAIAIGFTAVNSGATNSVQLGTGTNSNPNTIQFLSAGSVDTNEWARIAALSTYPTTNISVVGTNNTNTLVFSNGILVEVQ